MKKEKWHPTRVNSEFTSTLDYATLTNKYGQNKKTNKDTYKLSRFDLNKLLNEQRRYVNHEFNEAEQ